MLEMTIGGLELFDGIENFITLDEELLCLEHSLVSVSKWEALYHKPFLSKDTRTHEETIEYIKCMILNDTVDFSNIEYLTDDNIIKINEYIDDKMTASTFKKEPTSKVSNEQITSELIYYWMIELKIPIECEKWHLNRLLTLIKICEIKSKPPKKMSRNEILSKNAAANAARRAQLNSSG